MAEIQLMAEIEKCFKRHNRKPEEGEVDLLIEDIQSFLEEIHVLDIVDAFRYYSLNSPKTFNLRIVDFISWIQKFIDTDKAVNYDRYDYYMLTQGLAANKNVYRILKGKKIEKDHVLVKDLEIRNGLRRVWMKDSDKPTFKPF